MRKSYIVISALFSFLSFSLIAGEVSLQQAKLVSNNFIAGINGGMNSNTIVTSETAVLPVNGTPGIYVFQLNPGGFILVSAEDAVIPVLGYSFEDNFDLKNLPPQLNYLMDLFTRQISVVRSNSITPSDEIKAEWEKYQTEPELLTFSEKTKTVSPLLPCNWDQGKYYNEMCPKDNGGDAGHVYVGCVATAMAQVMYYYRYPNQGSGTHSYTHPSYGLQSVNYGNTAYDWNAMLNQLPTNNLEVAKISYHAGVAINMDFGPQGSGASTGSVPGAMINNFGYNSSCVYYNRFYYSTADWHNLIKTDLDLMRPVMYSGNPTGGGVGHCWVVDGYQNTNYYHMNFGWSGGGNGYYYIDNIAPPGAGNFNGGQGAVFRITPGSTYPYYCTGQTIIHTSSGTLEDGSGPGNYQANGSCSWLISPDDSVTSIKIAFNKFDTENGKDIVKIYNGATTSDPLLGTYSGNTLPSNLTINNTKVLITFETDSVIESTGWFLTYSATYPKYCMSENLNAPTGTITDGSGNRNYQPNTICTWIIQPAGAAGLLLHFTAFETEASVDYVKVYDLNTQALLGNFSGNTIPPDTYAPTGAMYIEFRTSGSYNFDGWSAQYSTTGVGIKENGALSEIQVFPVPARNTLSIESGKEISENLLIILTSIEGKVVYKEYADIFSVNGNKTLDISKFAKGIYFLAIEGTTEKKYFKVIID
jgi:hypothetical protein